MGIDLRQVMASVLTFSMFIMLGNMIKRDHIDPFLGGRSILVQYSVLKVSSSSSTKPKPAAGTAGMLDEKTPWKYYYNNQSDSDDDPGRPCWKYLTFKDTPQSNGSNGYILFSLTHGPEFHASQVANAVAVARHLGATLVVPDIRGSKLGQKWNFEEIYNVDQFVTSLKELVPVDKNPPPELSNQRRLPVVRVPDGVSENYTVSSIKPIFQRKRILKIVTLHNSSEKQQPDIYRCLVMSKSLNLQPELQQLVDSMVRTLRGMSTTSGGRFLSIDIRVKMQDKTSQATGSGHSTNAQEIGEFLDRVGFHNNTTIYVTQTGWHDSLNPLRNVFPNTFTKDVIMPPDEKAKFGEFKNREYYKFIDYYMCVVGDVFVPSFQDRFYEGVVGERITRGKTQILVPTKKSSESAVDYIPTYIAKKQHYVYSCFC